MNRKPTPAELVGMTLYNRWTREQRAYWHLVANSPRPVDAYHAYCHSNDRGGLRMNRENARARVKNGVAEMLQEHKTEKQLNRLAAMPDLLGRYDAATNRIAHLSILIDWIANELKTAKRAGNPYPKRLTQAVDFLQDEIKDATAEQESEDV